jgi:hypothetical protein
LHALQQIVIDLQFVEGSLQRRDVIVRCPINCGGLVNFRLLLFKGLLQSDWGELA